MKRIKKLPLFITIAVIISISTLIFFIVKSTKDVTSLTIVEKKWIEKHKDYIIDVSIINNIPIFGNTGEGVFFEFLNYFKKETGLELNKKPYNLPGEKVIADYFFQVLTEDEKISKNDLLFFRDNLAIVGKNNGFDLNKVSNYKIGILEEYIDIINNYIESDFYFEIVDFETIGDMNNKLESNEIDYIIVPRNQYLNIIVEKRYDILYQFNDLYNNYVFTFNVNNKELNSILEKTYKKWIDNEYNEIYVQQMNDFYFKSNKITEKEKAAFKSKVYTYGYVNNLPYDYYKNGKLRGLNSEYLREFEKFSGVQFEFKRYSTIKKLQEAIDDGIIDIAFNYYMFDELKGVKKSPAIYNNNFVVLSHVSNNITIDSFYALRNIKVNMLENTVLYDYIKEKGQVDIKKGKSLRFLTSNKNNVIILDSNIYNYYKNTHFKNYYIVYSNNTYNTYNFIIKDDNTNNTFSEVLSFYLTNINKNEIFNKGFYNTTKLNNMFNLRYIYYILLSALVTISVIIFRKRKRIRRERVVDKSKYMDQLTSLKNRMYLADNIKQWDMNKTYPKAIIVIDLNDLKEVNSNYGYEEGDLVIKGAANILINTQLDNSEIIRSDGDEFTIYAVGIQENQVAQYIRKVYKAMQELPYEYGATLGYSMITKESKNIEDAINEAIEEVNRNKEAINK